MSLGGERFPKVFVITLNWNRKTQAAECLNSVKKLRYPNFDIVVVDNGSTDGSVPFFQAEFPDVTVIENTRNLGYAEGFNEGLKYAYEHGADYFLILNNDTVVDPDVLTALVRVAEGDERIGFVSGKVYFYNEPNRLQTAGRLNHPILLVHDLVRSGGETDRGQYDEMKEYDYLDDIYLLVRRRTYEETGGYDPHFFLYFEETDWCARARRAGFKLVYTPEARVWHKHGMSTGGVKSPTFVYYHARNQIVFIRRNCSSPHFVRYLGYLTTSSPRRMMQWIRHRRFDLLSAYVRGVSSGILWLIKDGRRGGIYISASRTVRSK